VVFIPSRREATRAISAIVRRAKYSYAEVQRASIAASAKRKRSDTHITVDSLMEMVNRLMFDSSVSSIDLIHELGNLRSKSGRISRRRRSDLHQDDLVSPLGVVVEESLVGAELRD